MAKTLEYLATISYFIALQLSIAFAMIAMVIFSSSLLVIGMNQVMAFILVMLYAIISVPTYFLYRSDKKSAQAGAQRIPEKLLHLMELAGGWPGALIAQQQFRHKTKKESYRIVFNLILMYHALIWITFFLFGGRLGFVCFLFLLVTLLALNVRITKSS